VAELSASSRAQRLPTTCPCLICSRTLSEACRPYVCRASAAGFRGPRGRKVQIDEAKLKVGRLMFDSMREYGFTVTEHDPDRPWMVRFSVPASEHRTIKLIRPVGERLYRVEPLPRWCP
jgi:hypothetical protein